MKRVLETRRRRGMIWRRYRGEHGTSYETYEIPAAVLRKIPQKVLQEELQRAERTRHRKERHAKVLILLRQGWKPAAVANEVGLSESQVYRISYSVQTGTTFRAKTNNALWT